MKHLKNNIPDFLNVVSAVGLSAIGIFKSEIEASRFDGYLIWLFCAFLLLACIGVFINVRRRSTQKDVEELEKENRAFRSVIEDGKRNYFDIWDDKARTISQSLQLDIRARLSIYKFINEEKCFWLLGRYSENASFRERGRATYPSDQGVVGMAWEIGEYYFGKLPSFESNSELYFTESEKKFKLPRKTLETMNMKSRAIYAKHIKDTNGVPVAVIVIESMKRDAFDPQKLKQDLEESYDQVINDMLDSFKSSEPSLRIAKELGL